MPGSTQILPNGLPKVHRFITDHDAKGKAVFRSGPAALPFQALDNGALFALSYATNRFPVEFSSEQDIKTYQDYLENLPGITIPGGTVLRVVDMPPGSLSPLHRTVSLDYGVMLEGTVQIILDSGESRILNRGDIVVQRGTSHAWKVISEGWARMMFVLQEAKAQNIGGTELSEDYGEGMSDVRPSNVFAS